MRNIKLTLQYDGTRYLGWSRPEKDGREKTVSHRISSVLERLTGTPVVLFAGAKTESRVHALAQTANFQTESLLSPEELRAALNQYLPQDISVLCCDQAPERFRADLNAVSRTYEYRICTSEIYDVFTAAYSAHLHPAPDLEAMRRAADLLMGEHDFSGFSGARKKRNTQKKVLETRIGFSDDIPDLLVLSLTADDFLYQMPSLIAGTLLDVGQHKLAPDKITDILNGQQKAGTHCDPKGLFLHSVTY